MHSADVTAAFARTLVDEWVRAGVKHAVVAPGSRSTPLALALWRDARIDVHVVLDERSAAFVALGIGKASAMPAVLLCTSGTAAANFHPAVIEAHHANVPLLVCTADRPPELRDVGAPQTIDQANLYGTAVRWYHDPGPPEWDGASGPRWRALASRAFAATCGARPGPVHLNLPFREPLVPTGEPLPDVPGRDGGAPWTISAPSRDSAGDRAAGRLIRRVESTPRGLVVAGFGARVDPDALARFSAASGWPVLADPVSNARTGPHAVSTYEALVRVPGFADAHRPDVVLRVGAPLTSKFANAFVDDVPTVAVVAHDDEWLDPPRAMCERVVAGATELLETIVVSLRGTSFDEDWWQGWHGADTLARRAIDDTLDADDEPIDARAARDLAAALPASTQLVVASSLPVRALEWAMAPRPDVTVHANRGANGIDGFTSTVLGIAAASPPETPVVGFCGDLCFLHDANGLLAASAIADRGGSITFVVVDNRGGGIFSYLPQHEASHPAEFEALFGTPQTVDIAMVAAAHGVTAERIARASEIAPVVSNAIARPGVNVVIVDVDREHALARHRALWDAVRGALSAR